MNTITDFTNDIQTIDSAHYMHPFTDHKGLSTKGARIITKAENIYIWDSKGNKILDAMSGLWCVNVGYGQHTLVDAATKQMTELPYYNSFSGKQLELSLTNYNIWTCIAITLIGTLAASSIYPALLLSSFEPLKALKGKITAGNGNTTFRKV